RPRGYVGKWRGYSGIWSKPASDFRATRANHQARKGTVGSAKELHELFQASAFGRTGRSINHLLRPYFVGCQLYSISPSPASSTRRTPPPNTPAESMNCSRVRAH